MKKLSSKHTKLIICLIIAVIVIVCSVVAGLYLYEQKQIEEAITEINGISENFEGAESREKKLEILSSFISAENTYSEYEEVTAVYDVSLDEMKNYFISEYDSQIEIYASLLETEDLTKVELNELITELEEYIKSIESEVGTTIDEKTFSNYNVKLAKLIDICNDKLETIRIKEEYAALVKKKEEEEAKRKAEEEAKRKAEEEAAAAAAQSSSDSSCSSNSSSGTSGLMYRYAYDPKTGEILNEWYIDQYYNVYDMNGNPTGEREIW